MPRRNEVDYIIKQDTLTQLFNDSVKEFVIYGISETNYLDVGRAIEKLADKKVYNYCTLTIENHFSSEYRLPKTEAKDSITNLLIENSKRENNNQPLLGLIFCVALKNGQVEFQIDSSRIATSSKKSSNDIVTDAEVRRIFKHVHSADPIISSIAKKTFKFVSVNVANNEVELIEQKDFLNEATLKAKLDERAIQAKNNSAKLFAWRDIIANKIENTATENAIRLK